MRTKLFWPVHLISGLLILQFNNQCLSRSRRRHPPNRHRLEHLGWLLHLGWWNRSVVVLKSPISQITFDYFISHLNLVSFPSFVVLSCPWKLAGCQFSERSCQNHRLTRISWNYYHLELCIGKFGLRFEFRCIFLTSKRRRKASCGRDRKQGRRYSRRFASKMKVYTHSGCTTLRADLLLKSKSK